jgi:dTDP-4-dehydrorhamnose 3,5-epimerase-like enzyme
MKSHANLDDVAKIALQSVSDERGFLVIAEDGHQIPFPIKRLFSATGVPSEIFRGDHAHRELHQLLICLSGSVEVTCDDGDAKKVVILDSPASALHIPPAIWSKQVYQDERSVLLVLCDSLYNKDDYLRDYGQFVAFRKTAYS